MGALVKAGMVRFWATWRWRMVVISVLSVTYAYQEATAPGKRNQYNGGGITYGETKTVKKDVTQLPFTFDIDAGGSTPPKMLFVERALKGK